MNQLHTNTKLSDHDLLPSLSAQSQQSMEFSNNDLQSKIGTSNRAKIHPIQILEQQKFKKQLYGAQFIKLMDINQESMDPAYIQQNLNIIQKQKETKGNGLSLRLFFIKKFIRIMKSFSGRILFKELKKQQIDLIDDKSVHYKYFRHLGYFKKEQESYIQKIMYEFEQTQFYNQVIKTFSFCFKHFDLLILPNEFFSMIWNIFMLFLLVININYVCIQFAFQIEPSAFVQTVMDDLPNYGLIIDMLFNFNTGYYSKGLLILDRKKIVIHYLKKRFIWDLIIITLYFTGKFHSIPALQLILMLRIYDVYHIYQELEQILRIKQRLGSSIDMLKLILFVLFLANLGACSFHKLAQIEIENGIQGTWLDSTIDRDWWIRYIDSFYFTIVTMSTLGYGDITPKTYIEKIFTIVLVLLSCFVFAFCMNSVGEILKEMGREESLFKEKMGYFNIYMEQRGLDPLIQVRVRKYYEYLYKEEMENNLVAREMINKLTQELKYEVQKDIYGKLLRSKKIFSLYFSSQFIDQLALRVKENRIPPEEVIFRTGEDSNNLYFVLKGKVRYFNNKKNFENKKINQVYIQTLEKGQLIGELGFFGGKKRFYSCKTLNVTSLAQIDKKDFMELLKEFPQDCESFNMIKDNLNLYNNSEGLGISCLSCQSFNHEVQKCPFVNVRCNISKILYQHRSQIDQYRAKYSRNSKKSIQSLKNLLEIKDAGYELCVEQSGTLQYTQQYLKKNMNEPQIESFSSSDTEENEIPRGYQEFQNELTIIEQKMHLQIEKILEKQKQETMITISYSQLEQEKQGMGNIEQNVPQVQVLNQLAERRKSRMSVRTNIIDFSFKNNSRSSLAVDKLKIPDLNLKSPKLFTIQDTKDLEENDSNNEEKKDQNIKKNQNLKLKIKKPKINANNFSFSLSESENVDKKTPLVLENNITTFKQNQQVQKISPQIFTFLENSNKNQQEQKDITINQQKDEPQRKSTWIKKVTKNAQKSNQNNQILSGLLNKNNLYKDVPEVLIPYIDKYTSIEQLFENDFEKVKSFEHYFNWNNVEIVLKWFEEIQVRNTTYQKIKVLENIRNMQRKKSNQIKQNGIFIVSRYKNIYKKKKEDINSLVKQFQKKKIK